MFEKLFDEVKRNLRNPKLYIFILLLLVALLLLFPYIDANIFYYNRVNSRIDILEQITQLDIEKIQENEILEQEYHRILEEISKQSNGSLGRIFITETDTTVNMIKFVSGGFLFWILAIACFFIKNLETLGRRFFGFILIGGIGCLFGLIAKSIPTIVNPVINYVGFPLLLLIIIALLVTSGTKQSTPNKGTV